MSEAVDFSKTCWPRTFEKDDTMRRPALSFNARKSLCNHLGEDAGNEVADLLNHLASRVHSVERTKVDITPIISAALLGEEDHV